MATNTTIGNWKIDANGVATKITQSGDDLIKCDTVGQVNNNASLVHVRKGAGTGVGCDIITSVNSGQLLMIMGKIQPVGETLPWYEISLNGLLKLEIDLSKLNINPASYLFTHNISQYLIDKRIGLNNIMDNADKSKFANTQNPEKLYGMIRTLCYTFLQVGSTQIILEMKEINQNEVVSTLENLLEGKMIDINTVGKALIIGGSTAGTLYTLNRALIILGTLAVA